MSNPQRIKQNKPAYRRADVSGYPGRGERNVYQCGKCRGRIVVIHTHPGVTPMFLACRATVGCTGQSVSAGYPAPHLIDALGIPGPTVGAAFSHLVKTRVLRRIGSVRSTDPGTHGHLIGQFEVVRVPARTGRTVA